MNRAQQERPQPGAANGEGQHTEGATISRERAPPGPGWYCWLYTGRRCNRVFIRMDRQSRRGAAMASLVALQCPSRLPPVVEARLYRLATNRSMMT